MAKGFPYGIKEPAKIPDVADKVLIEYFQIAKELKIPTCLAYGTCLGFVRDGGYIPSDNDLDVVAVTVTNMPIPALSEALIKAGFKRGVTFPLPMNNVHFHKDGILVDIFFRKPEKFYAELDHVAYKGKDYAVPHPVEEYLSACYTDWKVKSGEMSKYYG